MLVEEDQEQICSLELVLDFEEEVEKSSMNQDCLEHHQQVSLSLYYSCYYFRQQEEVEVELLCYHQEEDHLQHLLELEVD
jgi:hypothetical protein